ncbi:MAG TPA: HAMP domain-containing sensor histidine kinase [Thermodesulfovibrionales bacterium]|nr:HAMP domain-containing sensor histidine kinase [Thermodesulfovibrionales bacterium]
MAYLSSLRSKITLGYYGTVAIVVVLSLATFIELRFLEKRIMFGEIIAEFFDSTLEVRRFEKNFFLYGNWDYYAENKNYISKAQGLMEENIEGFRSVATPEQIEVLRSGLRQYRELIANYASTPLKKDDQGNIQRTLAEGKIRETGKHIVTVAEEISKTERKSLQSMLNKSQGILIFSVAALVLLAIAVNKILSRMVVKPLKALEESMKEIAGGKFGMVSINSGDREIVSLTSAFNRMLKELEVRQRHLVQSEKLASLGTLLSGVAHELNNPLSNISSSCQILMEEIEGNDMDYNKELLAQVDEQTDRARNIVRSLLEFSREKGFKKEMLPLRKLFEDTVRFVKGQLPAGISLLLDVPDDIVIFADKQRIQQAFLNLLKNAIEAIGEEGSVFITGKKHRAVDKTGETTELHTYLQYRGKCTVGGDTIDIEIRDDGPGIPPEIVQRIFDPFFTTKDVGKGSGLGLFIVYEIIEEHDGCIAVKSDVGKGTTFFISLPAKEQ